MFIYWVASRVRLCFIGSQSAHISCGINCNYSPFDCFQDIGNGKNDFVTHFRRFSINRIFMQRRKMQKLCCSRTHTMPLWVSVREMDVVIIWHLRRTVHSLANVATDATAQRSENVHRIVNRSVHYSDWAQISCVCVNALEINKKSLRSFYRFEAKTKLVSH